MIHDQFISKLKKLAPEVPALRAMLLIGSCGRGMFSANSDIDVQLLVEEQFDPSDFSKLLQQEFSIYGAIVRHCTLRDKLTVYFEQYPKIDIGIFRKLPDINRNFIGSELHDIARIALYLCPKEKASITQHLEGLLNIGRPKIGDKEIDALIERFVCEFESASTMHRRSDAYQFYFYYNIALQCVVQLASIAHGVTSFNFLPKKFNTQCDHNEQRQFGQLAGTLFLPDSNKLKRLILDYFYSLVEKLSPNKFKEIEEFCEMVYRRDYFWNFRDLALHISDIAPKHIYRSSALCLVPEQEKVLDLLRKYNIKTIIDLRAINKDLENSERTFRKEDGPSYSSELLEGRNYVLADLDPWNQPQSFIESEYYTGTNAEIAYRFYIVGCKPQICKIMKAIIESSGPVLIHCSAGKDRTGIVAAMLALLAGSNEEIIIRDYLASEQDTKEEKGIECYLKECGLTESQIQILKQKLRHG